jgi:hypothetical protein
MKTSADSHRKMLVQHLVRAMEQENLSIEAATIPGHRRPARQKLGGLKRSRLRPDVLARDGRRAILGLVLDRSQIHEPHLADELEAFAVNCRLLVICVAADAAEQAIDVFVRNPRPHWGKLRLLTHPGTQWEEVAKAANQKRVRKLARAASQPSVYVRPDG